MVTRETARPRRRSDSGSACCLLGQRSAREQPPCGICRGTRRDKMQPDTTVMPGCPAKEPTSGGSIEQRDGLQLRFSPMSSATLPRISSRVMWSLVSGRPRTSTFTDARMPSMIDRTSQAPGPTPSSSPDVDTLRMASLLDEKVTFAVTSTSTPVLSSAMACSCVSLRGRGRPCRGSRAA